MGTCNGKPEHLDTLTDEFRYVNLDDFVLVKAIGKGGFGKVWKVQRKRDNKVFAMKEMLKARVMAKKSVESVMKELELMCRIDSEFIVNV